MGGAAMKIDLTGFFKVMGDYVLPAIGACAWMFFGFWLASLLARMLYGGLSRKLGADTARTLSKAVKFLLILFFAAVLIYGTGMDVKSVLGAAGVAGVAIGFAAQTSLSNLISGMFLLLEHPFKVGDWIEVDSISGYVHSVELLSTYIRTFDNRMVRIPNELVAKSKLINYTHYAIRRMDLDISVSCKEDAGKVMQIFREAVAANPACFNEPEPVIVFKGFGGASLDFLLAVWTDKNEMQSTRTSLMKDMKERFDREGIALPYERYVELDEPARAQGRNEARRDNG